jgi:hypothetical protein
MELTRGEIKATNLLKAIRFMLPSNYLLLESNAGVGTMTLPLFFAILMIARCFRISCLQHATDCGMHDDCRFS